VDESLHVLNLKRGLLSEETGNEVHKMRTRNARPLDPKIEKEAKAKALDYYEKKTQKKGASARVTDFGCHIQVDIIEDGKVVVSLLTNREKFKKYEKGGS